MMMIPSILLEDALRFNHKISNFHCVSIFLFNIELLA